jgi:N-acetylmuramoyl-L-alanine amidase
LSLSAAAAQPLTGLARLDPAASQVSTDWRGRTTLSLAMSLGVPFRVYTLDGPPRLVVDFSELDFAGASPAALLVEQEAFSDMRFGPIQPGWTRLVADLAAPMLPEEVDLVAGPEGSGAVRLDITLAAADADAFAARSGVPESAAWAAAPPEPKKLQARSPRRFTVVLDPGHGGIDPGAERDGLVEKEVVLDFARTLRDLLRREGIAVVMTRDADVFVSLQSRTGIAHQAGASLFLSLHADALSGGGARGATVYTLSEDASDEASEQLAARHDRSDILAGVDLTGTDDQVTSVLLDLARRETEPRSVALANAIIDGMAEAGGPMNRKPWRQAGFSVLKSADIPSVLVEIGFLSSDRDAKNLADPVWRALIADGIARAIMAWRDADAARAALVRQ